MPNLTAASRELFRRSPDECFASLQELWQHCYNEKQASRDRWNQPEALQPQPAGQAVNVALGDDGAFQLNDWSFSQLCRMAGVNKDTINRLSPETASQALQETLPAGGKPIQALTSGDLVRSVHGVAYTRLWNADLLATVREFATDFEAPPQAATGATGLYCGQQDLFAFLIDPGGWVEIGGEAFAPGFFVYNSEVGRRSLGIQTFWFEQICQNHIVWDATDVVEFSRKHTANVGESLTEIGRIIEQLVAKRDARKDGFYTVVQKAMAETVADDSEEAGKFLAKQGLTRARIKQAVAQVSQEGKPFTIWTLVDALTRLNRSIRYAGDRTEVDAKAAQLLALAA